MKILNLKNYAYLYKYQSWGSVLIGKFQLSVSIVHRPIPAKYELIITNCFHATRVVSGHDSSGVALALQQRFSKTAYRLPVKIALQCKYEPVVRTIFADAPPPHQPCAGSIGKLGSSAIGISRRPHDAALMHPRGAGRLHR
jgi:hypothetical protein